MRFTPPADGLPCVRDWIVCWESMLHGIDLGRGPLSCNVASSFISLTSPLFYAYQIIGGPGSIMVFSC